MHINLSYVALYTPIYRLTERKSFHVQNCPCGVMGDENRLCA